MEHHDHHQPQQRASARARARAVRSVDLSGAFVALLGALFLLLLLL